MEQQIEARNTVDKDLFQEFHLYYKLYQKKRSNLRQNVSVEVDSNAQSDPS